MKAEIIAVGTEILLGEIVNTDAKFLSEELAALGISTYYQTVVGDNKERLLDAFRSGFERSDIIITSGGLGPTDDDITKETGAEYFGKELVLDENSYNRIESYFKGRKMAKTNIKQAYVPVGGKVLDNDNGTAPGIIIEENGKMLIMLPGPPNELVPMFNNSVKPYLEGREKQVIISRTLRLTGIGESNAAEAVRDIMAKGTNPTVAPYAKEDGVLLRITAKGEGKEQCLKMIEPVADEIYGRLGGFIYGEDDTTLAGAVVELLKEKGLSLATAESLTGGMLASAIVDIAGVSKVFKEGFVAYTNESKMKTLGVSSRTIQYYGAVSAETAAEMAKGAAVKAGADVGISTTGIAGGGAVANPTVDDTSYDKPVGRVYIGIYCKGKTFTKELNIKGSRQKVRSRTVSSLLDFLRVTLKGL
ncbi:MAG: competence/damage-inducible protein A [Clostridiales bacterium]|nr:competence/damage-inducible protein A [Clostridiales bacterium]